MKTVETCISKTLWEGKWSKTRHHATEAEIGRRHSEAGRFQESPVVLELPGPDAEQRETCRNTSAGTASSDQVMLIGLSSCPTS